MKGNGWQGCHSGDCINDGDGGGRRGGEASEASVTTGRGGVGNSS